MEFNQTNNNEGDVVNAVPVLSNLAARVRQEEEESRRVLDMLIISGDIGMILPLRKYLCRILIDLWQNADGFSGKMPFGNSDWQFEVYAAMIQKGFVKGTLSTDGYVEGIDGNAADGLIQRAIVEMCR